MVNRGCCTNILYTTTKRSEETGERQNRMMGTMGDGIIALGEANCIIILL